MAEDDIDPLKNAIDDEISVQTVPMENRIISNPGVAEEIVVKFRFQPKNNATNSVVANTHYMILSAIK